MNIGAHLTEKNYKNRRIMSFRSTVIKSLAWKYLERLGTQGVQFVVAIVLARLLSPADFGLIALVMVFVALATVFVQSGVNTSLVQKKNADSLDFSTVFFASLAVAMVLYMMLFFASPFIADFYNGQTKVIPVLRVLGLMLPLGAINSVQEAYVRRNMMFKKLFYRSIGAVIPSVFLGIVVAYMGYGIWALVTQQLCNTMLVCVIMWFTVKWRPHLEFSFDRLRLLFGFGWKLFCSALLDTAYRNMRDLIIGKLFSPVDLGFYNRGDQFPKLIIANLNSSIQSVLLPSLSTFQDDCVRLKMIARRSIIMSSFLILPLMAGLAAVARPLTLVILGEKWLPAVPFIQICCFSYAFWPIHTTNLTAINSVGRSDIFLKLEIIKKAYGFAILVITIYAFRSPVGIAMSAAVSAPLGGFVNAHPNKKLLNYGYAEQVKDVLPYFMLSVVMGVGVFALSNVIALPALAQLPLLFVIGASFYLLAARLLHLECLEYILNMVKEYRKKNEQCKYIYPQAS